MSEKILVCVAWPYCNGDMHIGHIAGAYLPADIFARYHRLRGNDVLMVSGSDTHGTPITVRAEEEGITPREVVDHYHPRNVEMMRRLGISFDLFTETDTENHWAVTQELFTRHIEEWLCLPGHDGAVILHHLRKMAGRPLRGGCLPILRPRRRTRGSV